MLFDRFRARPRRHEAMVAAVRAVRASRRDQALVYDVDTGEVHYLPSKSHHGGKAA